MAKNNHSRLGALPAVSVGVICAWAMCLSVIGGLAKLTLAERVGERGIVFLIPLTIAFAVFVGGRIASAAAGGKSTATSLAVGGIYLLFLIVTGMSLDGSFGNVLYNFFGVVIGSGISCALCIKKKGLAPRRKKTLLLK